MAKVRKPFVCQSCGAVTPRWAGKCAACGAWNRSRGRRGGLGPPALAPSKAARAALHSREPPTETRDVPRLVDRHRRARPRHRRRLRAGLGRARSAASRASASPPCCSRPRPRSPSGRRVVYVSGEEAAAQVRLRAERLGLCRRAGAARRRNQRRDILATLGTAGRRRSVVIDSIQTLWTEAVESAPGTVTQVRACARRR